jgi:tape measure domain-containing protein
VVETLAELGIKITPKGIREAARALDDLADKSERAERKAQDLEGQSGKTGNALTRLMDRFKNVLGPAKALAAGAGAAALALGVLTGAAAAVLSPIIRTGAQFETMSAQLTTVMGGVQAGKTAMDWILRFTSTTPYQLEQVTGSFVRLKAAGLDPTDDTLRIIGDSVAAMGGGAETLDRVVNAVSKIATRGKLSAESLELMTDIGIPATKILQEQLGLTAEEAGNIGAQGIDSATALRALFTGFNERYGGAMATQMKTLNGLWSNFKDQITLALKAMAEGGVLEAAKSALKEMLGTLSTIVESGAATQIGRILGDSLGAALPIIEAAVKQVGNFVTGVLLANQVVLDFRVGSMVDELNEAERHTSRLRESLESELGITLKSSKEGVEGLAEEMAGLAVVSQRANEMAAKGIPISQSASRQFIYWAGRAGQLSGELEDLTQQSSENNIALNTLADGLAGVGDVTAEQTEILENNAELWKGLEELGGGVAKQQEEVKKTTWELTDAVKGMSLGMEDLDGAYGQAVVHAAIFGDETSSVSRSMDIAAGTALALTGQMFNFGDALGKVHTEAKKPVAISYEVPDHTDLRKEFDTLLTGIREQIQTSLGDVLYLTFTGQFDRLGEAFQGFFDGLTGAFTQTLENGLADALEKFRKGDKNAFSTYFGSEDFQTAMLGMAGSLIQNYGAQQAQQGNQTTGILAGMAGGALQGWVASGFNPIGAVVGAVVGGLTSWLGSSGEKEPHIRAQYVEGYGFDVYGAGDQQFSEESRAVWEQNMNAAMATELKGYRDTLMTLALATEDLSLLDLDTALGSIDFEKLEGTPDEIARWITDVWLPDQLDAIFGPKFQDGLEQLGLNTTAIGGIMEQIARLPVEQRLESLNTIITALASAQELMTGLTRDGIMADVGKDPFTAMTDMMDAAALQATVLSSNLDDMSPLEQAQRLQEINTLVANVRQAEIQYLQQLDSMQKAMNASIDAQIEDLRLGGMSDQQQAQYHADRILELWGQISSGDLTASQMTEAIAELQSRVGELQPFLAGAYSGVDLLGNETSGLDIRMLDLFGGIFGDNTAADWFSGMLGDLGLTGDVTGRNFLIELLDRARDLGNTTIDDERDAIIDKNQEYIDAIQGVIDAMNTLSGTVDDVFPGNGSGSGPDGPFNDDVPPMPGKAGGVTGDATHEYAMAAAAEQQTILLEQIREGQKETNERLSEISAKADRPLIAQAHVNTSAGGLEAIIQSVVISMFTPPEELQ